MFFKGNTIGIDHHKSWLHPKHSWPNILLPLCLLHGIKLKNKIMLNLNIFCCVSGMKLHDCGLQFHCVRVLDFRSFLHNLHLLLFTLRETFLHLLRYFAALLSSENCYYWCVDDFAFLQNLPWSNPLHWRGKGRIQWKIQSGNTIWMSKRALGTCTEVFL